jgi:glycosyltransferase involved in cell wall biosynthesis
MKIAVATIALNEEQFVQRWAESCEEADYRLILDTGSTDHTTMAAGVFGVEYETKEFTPWRFDHARNHAMSLIPDHIDYVIWLDMDEVLQPGWREALEKISPSTTRPRYKYVWSWNKDGSEGLVYGGDKIHARKGYTWKHPVHEVLKPMYGTERQEWVDGLEIRHHPDSTKSRSQYLPLLKLAVEEDPNDDRNQFYLARELFFHHETVQAAEHFGKHLSLSKWAPERAASCRYLSIMATDKKEYWAWRAVSEDPTRRENWVHLATMFYERKDWPAVRSCCEMAFRVKEKPLDYLCDADAWGSKPHDLMAVACFHLGDTETAWEHGAEAVHLNPTDERLQGNLRWYRQ